MKKIILLILICLLITGGQAKGAESAVKVVVEGKGDEYPHYMEMRAGPAIKNDIVMAPLPDLADELAWQVSFDSGASSIYINGNGRIMCLKIGSGQAVIDSLPVDMPCPPYIADGIIMIPLSFAVESMGYWVEYSTAWNNTEQIYITPYKLIADYELFRINSLDFSESYDMDGFLTLRLKAGRTTPGGIAMNSTIRDVLQVYGVPRSPCRSLNYDGDWTGTLLYWGTFVPNSGMGTFFEFTFEKGVLIDLTISC